MRKTYTEDEGREAGRLEWCIFREIVFHIFIGEKIFETLLQFKSRDILSCFAKSVLHDKRNVGKESKPDVLSHTTCGRT